MRLVSLSPPRKRPPGGWGAICTGFVRRTDRCYPLAGYADFYVLTWGVQLYNRVVWRERLHGLCVVGGPGFNLAVDRGGPRAWQPALTFDSYADRRAFEREATGALLLRHPDLALAGSLRPGSSLEPPPEPPARSIPAPKGIEARMRMRLADLERHFRGYGVALAKRITLAAYERGESRDTLPARINADWEHLPEAARSMLPPRGPGRLRKGERPAAQAAARTPVKAQARAPEGADSARETAP